MLRGTNIADQLRKVRERVSTESMVLEQVYAILEDSGQQNTLNQFQLDLLESNRIFHIDQIKKTCIAFRLRFLDSSRFKSVVPPEAHRALKQLEAQHNTQITGLKIMAPSKLFKLDDRDDPLLFAPLGNGYYYLVHQWGKDLHPLRQLLVWPLRDLPQLTVTLLVVSLFLTGLIPMELFTKHGSAATFWVVFFFVFKMVGATVLFYGFSKGKNFNPYIWNSHYCN